MMGIKERIAALTEDVYVHHGEDYAENYIGSGADLKALADSHTRLLEAVRDLADLAEDDMGKNVAEVRAIIGEAEKL